MYGRCWRFQQVFLRHGARLLASKKTLFNQDLILNQSIRNNKKYSIPDLNLKVEKNPDIVFENSLDK